MTRVSEGIGVPRKKMKMEGGVVVPKPEMATPTTPGGVGGPRSLDHAKLFRSMADRVSSGTLKAAEVKDILVRCSANLAVIGKDERILDALLSAPWTATDSENFDFSEYEKFLIEVLVADTNNLERALHVWLRCLLDETKSAMHERIHRLIVGINTLFPSTQEKAVQALYRCLSLLKKQSGSVLVRFTVHLLRMASYMPKISQDLMDLAVKSVAAVDVRLPEGMIAEFAEEENDNEIMADDEDSVAGLRSKAHSLDESTEILIKEFLRRLKTCRTETSTSDGMAEERAVIHQLLSVSGGVFLSCETTTHLQYVLFVICAASEPCAKYFLDWLWDVTRNPRSLPSVREAALGYMASFLCRARFLSTKQKQNIVGVMCDWAMSYIHQGPHSSTLDLKAHISFFATCQAIFYVIAFNHKQLFRKKSGLNWVKQLGLERIVGCPLNPLKFCLPDVVKNFANVARHYQIVYCYSIIERNKRSMLPELEWTENGELLPSSRMYLNPIFPFDKPVMPRCRRLVEPFYVEYNESDDVPPPPVAEDADSNGSNFFAESYHYHRERKDTAGSMGYETFDYSTSPGFVHW